MPRTSSSRASRSNTVRCRSPATLQALRADQWLRNHPEADAVTRAAIKRQMRDAFYIEREDWKAMVYAQARVAVLQALRVMRG